MPNRTLPFGYYMSHGKICVVEAEAGIVRRIVTSYAEGRSYDDLTKWLNGQSIPYLQGKPWNKNAVARILQDERYLGNDTYPPIITAEEFTHRTPSKTGRLSLPQVKDIRILARCGVCGEPIRRERKNTWCCPHCMVSAVPSTDQRLIDDVSELLRELCGHPEIVSIPAHSDDESANVLAAQNELAHAKTVQRQLRVAAYCRVSTDDEEQLTSYEAQQTYYTDKIMNNPQWTMGGIFADEGISGTSATKRPEFLRMIRKCRQGKFDLVLVKSISRFARNTVDCLNYIRALRTMGIAVIFEKENIKTLETDSEMLITMMGAFAQAESESMSANIVWGKRQAMREGKTSVRNLYAYEKTEDGSLKIIPEQAEVVRMIFDSFLAGHSVRMIKDELEAQGIPATKGGAEWSESVIRSILKNEKYCGDVLMQKTYTQDCISKKQIRNLGQLPMYLVRDNHTGIISRDTFNAVQAEFARRNAGRAPSQKLAPTGRSCYSAKYALTERLVCGECGTLYRRCVWTKRGEKFAVWRCASRVDYGKKYCHDSPTLREEPLQAAILTAINTVMSQREVLVGQIENTLRTTLVSLPGGSMSVAGIDQRLSELDKEFQALFAESQDGGFMKHADKFRRITEEMGRLKEQRTGLLKQQNSDSAAGRLIKNAVGILNAGSGRFDEWDESLIRQLVDTVKVLSKDRIRVYLRGGMEIEQTIETDR